MSLLGTLTVGILGNIGGLSDSFNQAQNQVRQFGQQMGNIGRDLTAVGKTFTAALTVPIVGLATVAVKSSIEFESAFAGVIKTVDATEKELADLRQGILNMSKEIPVAATEIAGIAEAAGQLGIEVPNILGFTRVMADLGVATNMSSDQAATSLARLSNITGMNQKDFDRLGSAIVALGNNFATTESEITEMALRLAGAGAQVGLTEADILGLAAALTSVGIEAEMGGSAISKVMVNMQVATTAGLSGVQQLSEKTGLSLREMQLMASNNSKGFTAMAESLGMTKQEILNIIKAGVDLEGFSKIAGMTSEQFVQAFETDAIGALGSFINGLGNAEAAGESAINMLQEMGITEVRLRDSLLRAGNANELFADAVNLSSQAWEENIALTKEAEQRYATTESQIQIMKNRFDDMLGTIGDAIVPVLMSAVTAMEPLLQAVEKAVTWFGKLDPAVHVVAVAIATITAAIGPVLVALGLMISSVGTIVTAFAGLSGAIAGAGGAIGILTGPIGIAVAAIVGLGAALVALWNNSETFRNTVTGIWEGIKSVAVSVFGAISSFVQEKLGAIKEFWDANGPQFLAAVENVFNGIKAVIEFIMPAVKFIIETVWTAIKQIISGALDVIMGVIKVFSGLFTGDFSKMWEGVKQIFKGAIDLIMGILTLSFVGGIKTALVNLGKTGVNLIKTLWDDIAKIFTNMVSKVTGFAKKMVDDIINYFKNLQAQAKSNWDTIRTFGASIWNSIKEVVVNVAKKIWDDVVKQFTGMLNGIKTIFTTIKTTISNIWDGVIAFFKGIDLKSIGENIIRGLINGIGSMASAVWDKAKEIASGIGNTIKKFFEIKSPSRLTTGYGENIGQGLANGMKNTEKQVTKSSKDLSAAADKEFKKAMNEIIKQADKAASGTKKSTEKIKKSFNEAFDAVQHQYKTGTFNTSQYVEALKMVSSKYAKNADQQRKISEEMIKVEKALVEAKKKLDKESFDHTKSIIEAKRQANEISLTQELEAWERVHGRYKQGSEERIEAEKNIQRVRQEIYDRLLQANDEFLKKTQEINKNVEDEENRLNEVYAKAVEERTKSIRDFAGLFDQIVIKADKTGEDLLANLRGQINYIDAWSSYIEELAKRGIDKGLLEELRNMGPKAMPELVALNSLTDIQLREYESLWRTKTEQARKIAIEELKGMRTDTDKQISELHRRAAVQLEEVRKEFETKVKSISRGTEQEFNAMKATMPKIGRQAMDGLLGGIESMRGPLMKTAKSIASEIAVTIRKALDVRSPSRVMMQIGEFVGKGLQIGIDSMISDVSKTAEKLANAAIIDAPSVNIGGYTSGNSNQGENSPLSTGLARITQNITIKSPVALSPSETARKNLQAARQLAMEWRL